MQGFQPRRTSGWAQKRAPAIAREHAGNPLPLWAQNPTKHYWHAFLDDRKTLYVQCRASWPLGVGAEPLAGTIAMTSEGQARLGDGGATQKGAGPHALFGERLRGASGLTLGPALCAALMGDLEALIFHGPRRIMRPDVPKDIREVKVEIHHSRLLSEAAHTADNLALVGGREFLDPIQISDFQRAHVDSPVEE